jgi:hypothetical protein
MIGEVMYAYIEEAKTHETRDSRSTCNERHHSNGCTCDEEYEEIRYRTQETTTEPEEQ